MRDPAHLPHRPTQSITRLAPEPVQRLVDLANLVPPGVELPSPRDFEVETLFSPRPFPQPPMPPSLEAALKAGIEKDPKRTAAVEKRLAEHFRRAQEPLAESVRRWLAKTFPGDECVELRKHLAPAYKSKAGGSHERYVRLVAAHAAIRRIAESDRTSRGSVVFQKAERLWPVLLPSTATVDDEGRLRFANDDMREALEGVKVHRIKCCPVCGSFFWAFRRDQPCCSRKCANCRRVRRWRERYPATYKIRRYEKAEPGPGRQ